MPDNQWYYADANSQQLGPYSSEQVRQLATNGTITPETLLWYDGLPEWIKAGSVEGIFENPATPAANPYAPPGQGTPGAASGGNDYPIPPVPKTSYGLFVGSYLGGIALLIIGLIILFAAASNSNKKAARTPPAIEEFDENGDITPGLKDTAPESLEMSRSETVGFFTSMALFVLGGISMTFGSIYSYIILFRAWHVIQAGGVRTTPGKAVGFLFIPFFNLYWIFIAFNGWAEDWTRVRATHPNLLGAPMVKPGAFLAGCICMILVPPVGIFLFFSMISQMCRVINYFASAFSMSQTPSAGLTGTKFY